MSANAELSTGRLTRHMIGRVRHYAARESPEVRIPPSALPREGSVSGARKGLRLPALEGLEPSSSVGSSLSKAALLRLLESVNLQTNKQTNKQTHQVDPYQKRTGCSIFVSCDYMDTLETSRITACFLLLNGFERGDIARSVPAYGNRQPIRIPA